MENNTSFRRAEIRKLFKKHRGSAAEVSRRAGVIPQAVSAWLKGVLVSANIEAHARAVALEILNRQQEAQADNAA